MMNTIIRISVCVFALSTCAAAWGQTQVPNTFQAGQPARAADVNANFDAIESAIDSNSTRIDANETSVQNNTLSISQLGSVGGVSVYTQEGVELGKFLGMRRIYYPDTVIYLLSNKGFVFGVSTSGDASEYGENRTIHFSELDCAGDAYIGYSNWLSDWGFYVGAVASAGPTNATRRFYTRRGGTSTTVIPYQSFLLPYNNSGGACQNSTNTLPYGWRAFPNDEAVTGVSNTPPVGTLVMGTPLP